MFLISLDRLWPFYLVRIDSCKVFYGQRLLLELD
nr:MAG TPA: hypothetical protein [Caudoviricetes sp.]